MNLAFTNAVELRYVSRWNGMY